MAKIQQFEFFTLDPNIYVDNRMAITKTATRIGKLTIDDVTAGDFILLNGVVGVDNDDPSNYAGFSFRIYKGELRVPGNEIYYALEEVGVEDTGDVVNVPISHVDVIDRNAKSISYSLTVQQTGDSKYAYIGGPITFTAIKLRPGNICAEA
jgi:hypothetical protein